MVGVFRDNREKYGNLGDMIQLEAFIKYKSFSLLLFMNIMLFIKMIPESKWIVPKV